MILGVGIDSVEIERFVDWTNIDQKYLQKTLNPQEIEYCLAIIAKAPERFAARFAAKEAFFKAFCQMASLNGHNVPFLKICHNISVTKTPDGRPELAINWENITDQENTPKTPKPNIISHISITHTKNTATVIVILESL